MLSQIWLTIKSALPLVHQQPEVLLIARQYLNSFFALLRRGGVMQFCKVGTAILGDDFKVAAVRRIR